jgi:N-acyl-D-amino-acid deacylase
VYDLVLRGGHVLDGRGGPAIPADVAVAEGRIVAVGDVRDFAGRTELDVDGAVVAPGFIDLHTHSDFTLPAFPRAESMLLQGVTTQVVGNCGFSPFPVSPDAPDLLRSYTAFLDAGLAWDWDDAGGYAAALAALPLSANVAPLVGHGALRLAVMGFDDRAAGPGELQRMRELATIAFAQGVHGLSLGLAYPPGCSADRAELVGLAEVAGRRGAFVAAHVRNEGEGLLDSVAELLAIGRAAGVAVQLSHLKAMGVGSWGRVRDALHLVERARAAGQDVLVDQYPYTASSTSLTQLLPAWALRDGTEALPEILSEPEVRRRIADDMVHRPRRDVDPNRIVISNVAEGPDKAFEGMRLVDIAARVGRPPLEAALDLLARNRGGVLMVDFAMSEDDVRHVLRHPLVAVASDGWAQAPGAGGTPHPRSYGTFARVLGHYVREHSVLRLPEAIRKMTLLPARRLGWRDRGVVDVGAAADLVVFDPGTIADRGTFEAPHQYAVGVVHVVVNGRLAVEDGRDTGVSAGRVLLRSQKFSTHGSLVQ